MREECKDCGYHYELTEEQKENLFTEKYDEHCGCESLDKIGKCVKADYI